MRKRTNHQRLALIIAVCLILLPAMTGCGQGGKPPAVSADAVEKVRTAYAPFIGGIGLYLMEEAGIDTANGIDLEIGAFGNTSTLMSVITGDVDIAFDTLQGYMTSINAMVEEGTAPEALPRIIYLHNESRGADGIVAKSDIADIQGLAGRQVAAQYGNVTHYMLSKALQMNGMSISDIELIDMSPGKAGAAFIAGNLDAATTFEPYLSQAAGENGGILITTANMPQTILDVVVVSAKVAEEKPAWIAKTLAATDESTLFCEENLDEAAEMTKATFESSADEVKAMYETVYLYTMQDNAEAMAEGGWLRQTLKDVQDFYVSIGEMSPDIDFSALVDPSFLAST